MKKIFLLIVLGIFLRSTTFGVFIPNQGQWNGPFQFKCNIPGGSIFLNPGEITYSLYNTDQVYQVHEKVSHESQSAGKNTPIDFYSFRMRFAGSNPACKISGTNPVSYYNNYYLSKATDQWRSNIHPYENLYYESLYPGIDLNYSSKGDLLKYEFIVAPKEDPARIQLSFQSIKPFIDHDGNLVLQTPLATLKENKPVSYQRIDGKQREVETEFIYSANGNISFRFPNGYDRNYELIIDPTLVFATYSGSSAMTFGWSATYDNSGHLYAGGECFGTGWPVTSGTFQQTFAGSIDVSINCYAPDGTSLIYSTYLGGADADFPSSLICTPNDELIVCGYTFSSNFPVTAGCFDNTMNGAQDIFVTSFNTSGTALLGSTYIGGNQDEGSSTQEVNYKNNEIIVASRSSSANFPITPGALQSALSGGTDGVVFKMDLNCSNLIASTYLGGSQNDISEGVIALQNGNISVVGQTLSTNFPVTPGAWNTSSQGSNDGYVSVLNSGLSGILYSSYISTNGNERAYRVQEDPSGNIYVCGQTTSASFPVSPGVYSDANGGIFILKFPFDLSGLILSTRIGSSGNNPSAFLLDHCENTYVSCQAAGMGNPVTPDAYQSSTSSLWIGVLTPNFGNLLYGTFMGSPGDHLDGGGSRFDPQGKVYQSICTSSGNVYQSPGCWSPTNMGGSWDIASMKFDVGFANVVAQYSVDDDTVCEDLPIQFTNQSNLADLFSWDFGDGTQSNIENPIHVFNNPGIYTVRLIAANSNANCAGTDTFDKVVVVAEIRDPEFQNITDTLCSKDNILLTVPVFNDDGHFTYTWSPSSAIVGGGNTHTATLNPNSATQYTLTILHEQYPGYCSSSATANINLVIGDTSQMDVSPKDTIICYNHYIKLEASGGATYQWSPTSNIGDPTTPYVHVSPATDLTYSVTITDPYGCSATKFSNIKVQRVYANAGEDQIVRYGTTVDLDGTKSEGNLFTWLTPLHLSDIHSLTPYFVAEENQDFLLVAANTLGCTDTDEVKIIVTNFSIPNAFSPNADGINDVFKIVCANEWTDLKSFRIYNRWGQNVFYTDNINDPWDGTFKGELCPADTYFYLAEISIGSKDYTTKGDITLIR